MIQQYQNLSIRKKMISAVALILFLISFFTVSYFPLAQKRQITEALLKRADGIMKILNAGVTLALNEDDYVFISELFTYIKKDSSITCIAILDDNDDQLIAYNPQDVEIPAMRSYSSSRFFEGKEALYLTTDIQIEEGVNGRLVMCFSLRERNEEITQTRLAGYGFSFVVFLLGIFTAVYLSRLITAPLQKIITTINYIGRTGDHQRLIEKNSSDEVGHLVDAFNELNTKVQIRSQALQEHHDQLEQTVQDRTASLTRVNTQLQGEITERKHAEEQIKTSLAEKEVLLKEIHHRIKNNLQIISSLLFLQSDSAADPHIRDMFTESQNRIRSMALIHEKLYQSPDLAKVDFAEYIRNLTDHLFRSYAGNAGIIKLEMNVKDIFLDIDSAIPCGLLINELISNSLKYAFPKGQKGSIAIDFFTQNRAENVLIVKDTGVGLPQDFDLKKTHTLGLQLVNSLSRQLKGTMELHNNDGTEFRLAFRG